MKIAVPMSKISYQDREYIEQMTDSLIVPETTSNETESNIEGVVKTTPEYTKKAESETPSDSSISGLEGDLLVINHRHIRYPVRFPSSSIEDGRLLVGDIRSSAVRRLNVNRSDQMKLFFAGLQLNNDSATARECGVRNGSEISATDPLGDDAGDSDTSESFIDYGKMKVGAEEKAMPTPKGLGSSVDPALAGGSGWRPSGFKEESKGYQEPPFSNNYPEASLIPSTGGDLDIGMLLSKIIFQCYLNRVIQITTPMTGPVLLQEKSSIGRKRRPYSKIPEKQQFTQQQMNQVL